jgi:hypothetical protein
MRVSFYIVDEVAKHLSLDIHAHSLIRPKGYSFDAFGRVRLVELYRVNVFIVHLCSNVIGAAATIYGGCAGTAAAEIG